VGYVYLLLAITAEIIGTTLLKYTDGFTKLWPSVGSLVGYAIAFVLLAQTLKSIEVGVTYALWSGIGTAAIAIIGALAFKEPVTAAKVAGIVLIIAGVVLLNLGGGKATPA
jgi:small multidrug resistance pump